MRVALAVPRQSFGWTLQETLSEIEAIACAAASENAHVVLFPELAATPGDSTDDPEHDLPLGQPIPGEVTSQLACAAQAHNVRLGIGMLERDGDILYDSAILFGPGGEIELKYRRIQPQWHGRNADPQVYRQGDEMPTAATDLGTFCFAICGDLFDKDIVRRVRDSSPQYVLWPIARNFSDGSYSQDKWDREEESEYVAAARSTGTMTFMVNRLVDAASSEYPSFGGALVVSGIGEVIARWPLARPGILYVDV